MAFLSVARGPFRAGAATHAHAGTKGASRFVFPSKAGEVPDAEGRTSNSPGPESNLTKTKKKKRLLNCLVASPPHEHWQHARHVLPDLKSVQANQLVDGCPQLWWRAIPSGDDNASPTRSSGIGPVNECE